MDNFESRVSDLDMALVFAELAAISSCPKTRKRNLISARDAYIRLRRDLCLYSRGDWQHSEIEGKLLELRRRLLRLGKKFA